MHKRFVILAVLLAVSLAFAGCHPAGKSHKTKSPFGEIAKDPETTDTGGPPGEAPLPPFGSHTGWTNLQQVTPSHSGTDFDPAVVVVSDSEGTKSTSVIYSSTMHSLNPDIFMVSVGGAAIRRLTSHPASDIEPAYTPVRGGQVAFASNRSGNWDIFVAGLSGSNQCIQVTRSYEDDIAPDWSPDGSKIVYSSFDSVGKAWNIWIYDVEANTRTMIGPGLFPKWSPASAGPTAGRIIFQRPKERESFWYELWMITVDGKEPTQVLANEKWAATHPSWCADGKRIVFSTVYKSVTAVTENRVDKGDDIYVIDADGRYLTEITLSPRADWNPVWGPDGRIYFSSTRDGYRSIWSIEPWVVNFEATAMKDPVAPVEDTPAPGNTPPGETPAAPPETAASHANPLKEVTIGEGN